MKYNKIFNMIALLLALVMTNACSNDDLVFDHEKPQFPTKPGAYLLEVIMPQSTQVSDDIYIVGAINGGDANAVVGDLRWKLEKCEANNVKWGIYLFPGDFEPGTSLADGYSFYNTTLGEGCTFDGGEAIFTEAPALGQRLNLTLNRWAEDFNNTDPGEIEHDGYVIYIQDQTTWSAIAVYAWGDGEIFGGWPGITPTGTVNLNGTVYKYFDTGADNEGLNVNLIFNNNGEGTQLADFNVTLDRDYYLIVTDNGCSEGAPTVEHDGYAIFVTGDTGWDEIAMYGWASDMPEIFGGWPGITPTGTETINGVTYQYFDTGADNEGTFYNFILNNNGGGKQFDLCGVTLDRNYYYLITSNSGTEIDPDQPIGPVPDPDPEPEPATTPHTIYIDSKLGWSDYALYAWGDGIPELFGGWPGLHFTETKTVDGVEYMVFPYEGTGDVYNPILNDNGGDQQIDGPAITTDRDYYFMVTVDGWTEVSPQLSHTYRVYVDDQTGWDALYLYAWGDDNSFFGGWPGMAPTGTETVGGTLYKYFEFTGAGENENLIFNNNNGTQLADFNCNMDHNVWLRITTEGVTEIEQ